MLRPSFYTILWLGLLAPAILAPAIINPPAFAHEGHGKHSHEHADNHSHADHGHADHSHASHSHADHDHSHQQAKVLTTRSGAKVIPPTVPEDAFQFIIYGDRTGGVPAGLKVLQQAVEDTNLLDPDLVLTVGDLIQGYNQTDEWLAQADEYKAIMNQLKMRWFPVAGNHDIYWRGEKPAPPGHHEANYEKHFGPLWYSFQHKNAGFIVLYSDEGDAESNRKAFNVGALQQMSKEQLAFLEKALDDLKDQDHVFVFLHHPRWIGGGYAGSNWDQVHTRLKNAGNVSAVFAGHIHRMRYDGQKDGIEYYALATTGGHIPGDVAIPDAGYLHHFNVVTVRENRFTVASLPVGAVFDPKRFTQEFLRGVELARSMRAEQISDDLTLSVDGSVEGRVRLRVRNPAPGPVEASLFLSVDSLENGWMSTLDHTHVELAAGETKELGFFLARQNGSRENATLPKISMTSRYLGEDVAVELPEKSQPVNLKLDEVPADFFTSASNHALQIKDESSAIGIADNSFELPDGPFTIETWVKPTAHEGYDAIIAKTQSSEYAFFSDHGAVHFDVHVDGRYKTAVAPTNLPLGKWSHIAGVYDGETVVLYIDGKRVDSVSAPGKRRTNKLPLFLGADPNSAGNPTRSFTGLLDEFRLSKTVRYENDFTPQRRFEPDQATVLLHHFDRTVGPFLLDHSNSAANGTLGKTSKLVPVE